MKLHLDLIIQDIYLSMLVFTDQFDQQVLALTGNELKEAEIEFPNQ